MSVVQVYLKVFIALYVLVNPLEGLPIYLARTESLDPVARRAVGHTAALAVTCILLSALVVGRGILEVFSISIGDFTAAGGVIIFMIALNMVLGPSAKPDPSKTAANAAELRGFGIVPLGTPLLAGPGPISAVIVYASRGVAGNGNTLIDFLILGAIIVAVGVATGLALRSAGPLQRILGETGIEVSTRISGILVAAIAFGMMVQGVRDCFPMLAQH